MAESVLTNTDTNFQAFRQATTYAQQRAQAAENARAAIAALIPDAQVAANAKADALLAAGAKADALAAASAKVNALAAAALLPDLRAARLAAAAAAGLIPHSGGDHTTIPAGAGVYRLLTSAEVGQIWERVAGGGVLRRPELEAAAATDVQTAHALAEDAKEAADTASALAGDVQARVDGAPIRAPAQARGVVYRGGVAYYPAPADLTPDGVYVIEEATGMYFRATDVVLPWEYNALPGTFTTRRNSGAQLLAWAQDQRAGSRLHLPPGQWYTDRTLTLSRDDLTIDWQGVIRPVAGFTDYLVDIRGDIYTTERDNAATWGAVSEGNIWQNRVTVEKIRLDGMREAKGLVVRALDHYDISNVLVRRSRGCAVQFDRCREGDARAVKVIHSDAYTDEAVFMLRDDVPGDGNNTSKFYGVEIVYCRGRYLYIDNPTSDAPGSNGSVPRFLDFFGIHVEDMPTSGLMFGSELVTPDGSLDRMWFKSGRNIRFFGGTINAGLLTNGAGGDASLSGSILKIGSNAEGGRSNRVESVSLHGVNVFAFDGDGYAFKLHNAADFRYDVSPWLAGNVKTMWVNSGSDGRALVTQPQRVRVPSGSTGLRVEGEGANSAVIELASANQTSRLFTFDSGQFLIQPTVTANVNYTLDAQGQVFIQGAGNIKLGTQTSPARGVVFQLFGVAPVAPDVGLVVVADRVGWNPLGRPADASPYLVMWDGAAWVTVS